MKNDKIKGRKNGRVFLAVYFSVVAVACIAVLFGLTKLWGFLKEYEQTQHIYVTDEILAELNSGNLSKIFEGMDKTISPYETEEALTEQITARLDGTFTCAKSAKYSTDEKPVFVLKCDDENVAYLSLKKVGKTAKYELDTFGFDKIYGVSAHKNENATVVLPSNCSFTVNGISAEGELYTEERIENAKRFGEYLKGEPTMRTYKFGGLMNPPDIRFFDKLGNPIPVTLENGVYSCELPTTDEAEAKSAETYAYEFARKYNEYISNDIYFYDLKPYLVKGTEFYENLRDFMAQFYSYHTNYEFRNKQINNVTQYSDNCYAVELEYDHVLYSYGREIIYHVSYIIFVADTEDGWKAVDLILN